MEGDKYNSVLNTATFLASKGEVRLALSLVKTSLEKFFIEKESLKESDIENEEKLNEIEVLLNIPIVALKGNNVGLARNFKGHWRLIGFGEIIE